MPERLRRARKRADFTLRQLADRAGDISFSTIPYIEGGGIPRIDIAERLAAGLGLPVSWLAFGPEGYRPFSRRRRRPAAPNELPEPHPDMTVFLARYRSCGERVRSMRTDRYLNRQPVADAAQLSYRSIECIEIGMTVPRLETVEAIAFALDVPPGLLAYGNELLELRLQREQATRGAQLGARCGD